MNEEEKIKNLKAVYSGAVQAGEIGIANMIKGGIDLIEKLQKENEKLKTKLLDILEGQKVIKEETPQYIKENYIQKDKIEEILSETEITDFNSLVEAFLEIKKLLESE